MSDPHWGMPLAALLNREKIKKYFLKNFRKNDVDRKDIPQLFSLNTLQKEFGDKYILTLNTKSAVQKLFQGDKGIIWSSFHLLLLKLVLIFKLDRLLTKLSNDNFGFVNKFISPNFYLILKKKL